MRVFRTTILVLSILLIAASLVPGPAFARPRMLSGQHDPSWSVVVEHVSDVDGEPDVGGSHTPPPMPQGGHGASRDRTERSAAVSAFDVLWLKWMGRIWMARHWGIAF